MAEKKLDKAKKFTGPYKEKSIVSHRFMEAYNRLKDAGEFDSYGDFSGKYGYTKDILYNISVGKQEVPIMLIWGMVNDFGVDPAFFFDPGKKYRRRK